MAPKKTIAQGGTRLAGYLLAFLITLLPATLHNVKAGGGVLLTTSDGYDLRTEALELELETTRVQSRAEILVTSPLGQLTAGQFTMTGDGGADAPYRLVFKNRVKLIYVPQN